MLGTNCDQCVSMVQCCFTSTETIRLVRTGNPGRSPRLSHSSWALTSSLYQAKKTHLNNSKSLKKMRRRTRTRICFWLSDAVFVLSWTMGNAVGKIHSVAGTLIPTGCRRNWPGVYRLHSSHRGVRPVGTILVHRLLPHASLPWTGVRVRHDRGRGHLSLRPWLSPLGQEEMAGGRWGLVTTIFQDWDW